MAKIDLDKSLRDVKDFSIWVAGMIRVTDGATQGSLANYLGISQPVLNTRIKGKTQWSLREYYAVQHYFGREFRPYENNR